MKYRFAYWFSAYHWAELLSEEKGLRCRVSKESGQWWVKKSPRQWCDECDGRGFFLCDNTFCGDHQCDGCGGRRWKK